MSSPSLSGPFRIDRPGPVPTFWVLKRSTPDHPRISPGTVLTVTDAHFKPGWMTLGVVSRQTPFGQGMLLGIHQSNLRRAVSAEIRRALRQHAPEGPTYRPECMELRDAAHHAALSVRLGVAFGDSTDDSGRRNIRPIVPATTAQLESFIALAGKRYSAIMRRWDQITAAQVQAILSSLS